MLALRSEEEIISGWGDNTQPPIVSICCVTYNHKSYIEDSIRGFLAQVTVFPFEIIIHDDASDDGTVDIVKKYSLAYPNIIKVILQNENQFKSNNFKFLKKIFEVVTGEYIAICEGDDYWTSSDKLSKQISAMKTYPNVNLSFHPCSKKYKNHIKESHIAYKSGLYTLEDCLLNDFHFIETNTIIFRKKVIEKFDYEVLGRSPVADVFIRIWASYETGALCVNEVMSIYRVSSAGSWTSRHLDCVNKFNFVIDMFTACEKVVDGLPGEYKKIILMYKLKLLNILNNCKYEKNSKEYKFIYASLSKYDFFIRLKINMKRKLNSFEVVRNLKSNLVYLFRFFNQ
jgi:glycosyltransferase involved in cell wall biosynthesis